MRSCTVRITKCDEPLAWYADKVGEVFEVYYVIHKYMTKESYDNDHYWKFIYFNDCEEVGEET